MAKKLLDTELRKIQHVNIVVKNNVQFRDKSNGLNEIELEYKTLPEINKSEISTDIEFLGKVFSAPLFVSGMTGGAKSVEQINKDIAKACEEIGIGMGVGSQRAMLEDPSLASTYFVRDVAPSIFLAGNIGVTQLKKYSRQQIEEMLDLIKADVLAVHINAAQEAVQPEGTPEFEGCLEQIALLADELSKPVYVKEVGAGISKETAQELAKTKIAAIDVGGAGGTSWTAVEYLRGNERDGPFWDWGIPTAQSIKEVREVWEGPLIATGGIRNGLDVAKAIALGADLAGMAFPVLQAQQKGGFKAVKSFLEKTINELRTAMFLIGEKSLSD